jgi:uncharacterized protein YecT (DUF1311 family)
MAGLWDERRAAFGGHLHGGLRDMAVKDWALSPAGLRFLLIAGLAVWPGARAAAANCAIAKTQYDLNVCADEAYRKSDAALNAAYQRIVVRLRDNPPTLALLVTAQKAWIAFRDAECGFSASGESGGSILPMVTTICQDGMTKERLKDLRKYLACKEGDLLCPVPSG